MSEPTRVSESEVLGLLRGLGEVQLPEADARARASREARFAERIDGHLERIAFEQRRVRRTRAWLLAAAAAIPLAIWGVRWLEREPAPLAIGREPAARHAEVPVPTALPAASESKPALAEPAIGKPAPQPSTAVDGSAVGNSDSTLALENQIFGDAVSASHSGNVDAALRGFARLLREYPRSPLAQSALVHRFRVLAGAGRISEARVEATRYLKSYPTGFAKQEAGVLANGRPDGDAVETPLADP